MKSLHTLTIVWLVFLFVIFLILSCFLWYVWTVGIKPVKNCGAKDVKWSDDCSYIQEKSFDKTIKKPNVPLYLKGFTESESLGPALGANVWYRYRYVEGKTGKYGPFSPWTPSPIIAGNTILPCKNGDCSKVSKHGADSCQSNLIELGIDYLDYPIDSGYYANIHRTFKSSKDDAPPDETTEDSIVGYLLPSGEDRFNFLDTSKSPCDDILCSRPYCKI